MKKSKRVKAIVLLVLMLVSVLSLYFGNQKASWYTEAQHLARVTKRIQNKYINGDCFLRSYEGSEAEKHEYIKATGFEVFPLYDENEKLKFFLVEFKPYGYLYVLIRDERLKPFGFMGVSTSMYKLSDVKGAPAWTPCKIDENDENSIHWETDSGEKIFYRNSPFAIREVNNQKRYFITYRGPNGSTPIPAVKKGGDFINLYSLSEFKMENGEPNKPQAISDYIIFINKKYFDL